jgi:hypothetical protein
MIETTRNPARARLGLLLPLAVALGACSMSTEDVRVTFCKNLTEALETDAASIEWTANDNRFQRPAFAVTGLSYEVELADGSRRGGRSACHYAYEALEDTALNLANPLDAYELLPFAMSINGRVLSDAELVRVVNAEQKRQGRAVIEALNQGARDLAEQVRAGVSQ